MVLSGLNMNELNKNKINLTALPAYQFFSIQERYIGTPYKEIRVKILEKYGLEVPESTIRHWFHKNGVLKDIYREYATEMNEIELEETMDLLKGNLKNAVKILGRVMSGKKQPGYVFGAAQVMAAKEFLDRGMGKVKEEVDLKHSGTVGTVDILKLIKEAQNGDGEDKNNNQGTE